MADDDLEEFMELASDGENGYEGGHKKSTKALQKSPYKNEESDEVEGKKPKQGQPVQYSHYGHGFLPTTSTIDSLPPGCYKIESIGPVLIFAPKHVITDSLLRLPDSKSDEVIKEVETFWTLKSLFQKYGFSHKRGFLLWGPPGSGKCLAKDTPVMMYDGSIKPVQDIQEGELLMGDDSTPRTVLSLARGQEMMYKITPTKGDAYTVNESHILSLKRHGQTSKLGLPKTDVIDITVKEWLEQSDTFKTKYKGYRVGVEFTETKVTVDPYFLGLWLGDGTTRSQEITTSDPEIVEFLEQYASALELHLKKGSPSGKAFSYLITPGLESNGLGRHKNALLNQMNDLQLIDNKHVPTNYKYNSRKVRLEVLAGLLDSDGHLNGCFDYVSKLKNLSEDVVYLSRSLGLAAYMVECTKSDQNGVSGTYYRVSISGDLSVIPTRVKRKQANEREQIKDVLVTGITVEPVGEGDYYGFQIDGNRRFLLGDFTVTHNTCTIAQIIDQMVKAGGIVILAEHPHALSTMLYNLREIEPNRPAVVIWEDLDTVIDSYGEAEVLAVLDGESQIDNVVFIATTNYPEKLDSRIVNRPSRFDRIVKIDMPNDAARKMYLEAKVGNTLIDSGEGESSEKIDLVKETKGLSIAHLRELIIGIYCQKNPPRSVLKRLHSMKVKPKSGFESESNGIGIGLRVDN